MPFRPAPGTIIDECAQLHNIVHTEIVLTDAAQKIDNSMPPSMSTRRTPASCTMVMAITCIMVTVYSDVIDIRRLASHIAAWQSVGLSATFLLHGLG